MSPGCPPRRTCARWASSTCSTCRRAGRTCVSSTISTTTSSRSRPRRSTSSRCRSPTWTRRRARPRPSITAAVPTRTSGSGTATAGTRRRSPRSRPWWRRRTSPPGPRTAPRCARRSSRRAPWEEGAASASRNRRASAACRFARRGRRAPSPASAPGGADPSGAPAAGRADSRRRPPSSELRASRTRFRMSKTFFGIQVVVRNFVADPLRPQLHEIIARSPSEQSLADKRAFWKRVAAVLNEAVPAFEMGYWDLVRGDGAEEEFESWSSEIEGSLATEKEELGAAADEVSRISAEKRYIIVTLIFLVEAGSNSDLTLGERGDVPKSEYWTRLTFGRLIATVPLLNFANVVADAVYLAPGSNEDGFSMEDVHGGGYEYLKLLL